MPQSHFLWMDVCACICLFVNAGEVSMEHLNEVVKLSELCKAAQDEPECDKQVGFLAYALLVQRRDRDAHTHPHTHARLFPRPLPHTQVEAALEYVRRAALRLVLLAPQHPQLAGFLPNTESTL